MNERERKRFYALKRRVMILTRLSLLAVCLSSVALLLSLVTSCTSDKVKAEPAKQTVEKVEKKSKKETKKEKDLKSLGTFTATAYCPCYKCSEGWGDSTSTGAKAKEGRTIAVDPSVIPYGTTVIINGKEYVAEDCGGAIKGKKIDIYFDTHEETDEWGKQQIEVFKK